MSAAVKPAKKSLFGGTKQKATDGVSSAPPARASSSKKKSASSSLKPKPAAEEEDDEPFVPEEEEAGAEQHALGTQGDGLMSAKFRRAKSTGPARSNFGDDDSGGGFLSAEHEAPAPRRPPAAS